MSRLTEYRKDLKRYEYKQDERGYCFIQEGQIVQKLGKLEDLEEEIGVNNLIAFLEWCVKFRNNFINRSFDDMVAFYKKAMCETEKG